MTRAGSQRHRGEKNHSYYSDYAGQSGVRAPAGTNVFFLSRTSRAAMEPTQSSIHWVKSVRSLG